MRSVSLYSILFLVLLACSAKTATTKTATAQAPVLSDGEWTLQSIKGEAVGGLKKPITLKITTADKRAAGYAGCNQFFSSYTLDGKSISFASAGRTKMFCKDTMDMEEKFLSVLGNVNSYKYESNKLLLLEGDTVLLEFVQ
jgi:heat shock protein HslJ